MTPQELEDRMDRIVDHQPQIDDIRQLIADCIAAVTPEPGVNREGIVTLTFASKDYWNGFGAATGQIKDNTKKLLEDK